MMDCEKQPVQSYSAAKYAFSLAGRERFDIAGKGIHRHPFERTGNLLLHALGQVFEIALGLPGEFRGPVHL